MKKFWKKKHAPKAISAEQAKIFLAEEYLNNEFHINTEILTEKEIAKTPYRYDIINFLLSLKKDKDANYLEIGVRDPEKNFSKINASHKFSVDPGVEREINLADFPYTSDIFFEKLRNSEILNKDIKFDVIFIDGLHLAEQVDRDIKNSLDFLKDDGFIVMHDCNPPTEFHASENYYYRLSPSKGYWNGTTWKAFFNSRTNPSLFSCCINTDWGVGVICKHFDIGKHTHLVNPYYEYYVMNENRQEALNLISFDDFQKLFV